MRYPLIRADLDKLRHNLSFLSSLCHQNGVSMTAVTKCICADERIAAVFLEKADMLADSRVLNLQKLPADKPRILLRVPMPDEAAEAVASAEISLQSEVAAIVRFGAEAERQGRRHRVILMIDLGDLREGIFYTVTEAIHRAAMAVIEQPSLELYGVGANLSCFGGILPDENNLGELVRIAENLRKRTGAAIPIVSGGNSSSIGLLMEGRLPKGVNHLRFGESILLGNDTATGRPINGLHHEAFVLSAELVELQRKPSQPVGSAGPNAFGETVSFPDEGEQLRGILAVGRQDTNVEGLKPLDHHVRILGASSDHLLVDLSRAKTGYRVGDTLSFIPDYGALLRAYTSPYIERAYQ